LTRFWPAPTRATPKLELDVAHYLQGGGDPVKAIEKYHDLLLWLHLKDVQRTTNPDIHKAYVFVELGQGQVDFPESSPRCTSQFRGWAIVELDAVPTNRAHRKIPAK
jgi:inosose dehydratase